MMFREQGVAEKPATAFRLKGPKSAAQARAQRFPQARLPGKRRGTAYHCLPSTSGLPCCLLDLKLFCSGGLGLSASIRFCLRDSETLLAKEGKDHQLES